MTCERHGGNAGSIMCRWCDLEAIERYAMTTPTPSSVWVVCDKEGECLFASEHKSIADDHFQHCVDEESDFRAGPYTLTEYVPKRDLAAAQSELASVKAHAAAMAQLIRMFTWMDKHGVQLPAGLYAQVSEYEAAVLAYRRDFPRTP